MHLPPVAKRSPKPNLVGLLSGLILGLVLAAGGSMLTAGTAAGEPSIQPLTGEPIIRTLEAGEAPAAASVGFTTPSPAATAAGAAKASEATGSEPTASPATNNSDASTAVTRRQLGLYAIVVLSLLGVMVIAIWLILRRGSDSRRVPARTPAAAAVVSPPAQALVVSPRDLHAGDPAWTRPAPLGASPSIAVTTAASSDSKADATSRRS